jgi:hypothetical protein
MKFTLIAENESIRESGTKITHEFYASGAEKAIEQFTKFLRGTGVYFEGSHTIHANPKDAEVRITGYSSFDDQINSYKGSSVFAHMAKDLEKNPPTMSEELKFDEIKIDINEFNFDNMGVTGGAGEDRITGAGQDDIVILSGADYLADSADYLADNCPVCNLPKNVMATSKCWDEKCPLTFDSKITEHSLR